MHAGSEIADRFRTNAFYGRRGMESTAVRPTRAHFPCMCFYCAAFGWRERLGGRRVRVVDHTCISLLECAVWSLFSLSFSLDRLLAARRFSRLVRAFDILLLLLCAKPSFTVCPRTSNCSHVKVDWHWFGLVRLLDMDRSALLRVEIEICINFPFQSDGNLG
jgi:hypothetical protein